MDQLQSGGSTSFDEQSIRLRGSVAAPWPGCANVGVGDFAVDGAEAVMVRSARMRATRGSAWRAGSSLTDERAAWWCPALAATRRSSTLCRDATADAQAACNHGVSRRISCDIAGFASFVPRRRRDAPMKCNPKKNPRRTGGLSRTLEREKGFEQTSRVNSNRATVHAFLPLHPVPQAFPLIVALPALPQGSPSLPQVLGDIRETLAACWDAVCLARPKP